MNITTFLSRLFRSPIPRVAIVTLIALACSTLAFCGEIHDAAKAGDLAMVKALLKENPNLVLSKDNNDFTPLHYAANEDHKDVVELLLANKAEVDAKEKNGFTPLHAVALFDHKDVAELLLTHGADVNAKANDGSTPLHYAALYGHKDVAELLRQHGGHE